MKKIGTVLHNFTRDRVITCLAVYLTDLDHQNWLNIILAIFWPSYKKLSSPTLELSLLLPFIYSKEKIVGGKTNIEKGMEKKM